MIGQVVSVNVGEPREVEWHGRTVRTAIWKAPVDGRRAIEGVNVVGDDQADRRVHGGPTKSVYAYAAEDYSWWADQLGQPVGPGTFGDNLTVEGVDPADAVVGERWRVGTATLRVTEPRVPCFKLGIRMGDAGFVDRFADAARPGAYFAIEEPGTVGAGDAIERLSQPDHALTIGDTATGYHTGDRTLLERMAATDDLSDEWRAFARRALARQ